MFADQRASLLRGGFSVSLCSDEALAGAERLRGVPLGRQVVYRGWMLKSHESAALVATIEAHGATAFTSPREYLATHHLPNWYPLLADFTAETMTYPANADVAAGLRALGWDGYFLKDYVKSLKTGRGSIVRDPSEVSAVVAEMREYRGGLEGGLCVRRVEDFVPGSEKRYFVLHGVGYAATTGEPLPPIVGRVAERVPSKFYSVDVARRRDEADRVVEIGDGQVSDLVGWTPEAFAHVWLQGAS
jgi:hypothetical protein